MVEQSGSSGPILTRYTMWAPSGPQIVFALNGCESKWTRIKYCLGPGLARCADRKDCF